jgi:hypothetical protein
MWHAWLAFVVVPGPSNSQTSLVRSELERRGGQIAAHAAAPTNVIFLALPMTMLSLAASIESLVVRAANLKADASPASVKYGRPQARESSHA